MTNQLIRRKKTRNGAHEWAFGETFLKGQFSSAGACGCGGTSMSQSFKSVLRPNADVSIQKKIVYAGVHQGAFHRRFLRAQ